MSSSPARLERTGPLVGRSGDQEASLLTRTVELLSTATSQERITEIVTGAVRDLLGADGATFVLREDDLCFYADEHAISPLWKGSRFPLTACISGWAMLNGRTASIEDIYGDLRIPYDAYRPTFVKSLAMAPIRRAEPLGALGAYWATRHQPTPAEVRLLEVVANSAGVALENLELRSAIERRSTERDQLAERADELESAIHTIAHDLRSPLGAIMGYAELIEDALATSDPGGQAHTFARTIAESGRRMADQIDTMLGLYRITHRPIEPAPLDLSALAQGVADGLLTQTGERVLEIDVEPGLAAEADPVLTHLLLQNLLGNAVKYTQREEVARIGFASVRLDMIGAPDPMVTFVVRDNGVGFPAADAGRLFRPMVRLHAEEDVPGTGLGLASAARIVELHGGTIRAEAAVGEGAAFYFTLPRVA